MSWGWKTFALTAIGKILVFFKSSWTAWLLLGQSTASNTLSMLDHSSIRDATLDGSSHEINMNAYVERERERERERKREI